jgi:hypothetical protein
MALEQFGMDKKWFLFFATIAICFIVVEVGFIGGSMFGSLNGEYEFGLYYDKLEVATLNDDCELPTDAKGTYYYACVFGSNFAGLDVNVKISGVHCLIDNVFSYVRNPQYVEGYRMADGLSDTLVKYGDATTFIAHIPKEISIGNPWVLMVAVTPMGYDGVIPLSSVFAEILVIQTIGV